VLFKQSDGETLAAFDHNRHGDRAYTGLSGAKAKMMYDRFEIWLSTSVDSGHHWWDLDGGTAGEKPGDGLMENGLEVERGAIYNIHWRRDAT